MSPHAFGSGVQEFGLEGGGMRKRCWRTTELREEIGSQRKK